jgi:hypothetical protein
MTQGKNISIPVFLGMIGFHMQHWRKNKSLGLRNFFKTRSLYVAQARLELMVLLCCIPSASIIGRYHHIRQYSKFMA